MTMIERLRNQLKEYDIRYSAAHDLIIRTPIKVEDFLFIKEYLKMYRIHIRNIVVETW